MCLLMTGKSAELRAALLSTTGLIEDIYRANSDGLGVMYATTHGLKVGKTLPASADAVRKTVQAMPTDERHVAVHFRYRTHGDVSQENVHPYKVSKSAWLMHNGILRTGNAADKSRSDTSHFVENYMQGLPDDTLHSPKFLAMVAEFIGDNRFAIMSGDGRLSVVNEDQGIHHAGLWFSNTYAWSPEILIPSYAGTSSSYGKWTGWAGPRQGGTVWGDAAEDEEADCLADAVDEALYVFDAGSLAAYLEDDLDEVLAHIWSGYLVTQYTNYREDEWSSAYAKAVAAWIGGDADTLRGLDPEVVAEALIHCCTWEEMRSTTSRALAEAH